MRVRLELVELSSLKQHEQVIPSRLKEVERDVVGRGYLIKPLIVDEDTLVIVDGHHRFGVLRRMGARRAPVILIDYTRDVESVEFRVSPHAASTSLGLGFEGLLGGRLYWRGSRINTRVFSVEDKGLLLDYVGRRLLPPKTTIHSTWAKRVYALTPLSVLF